MNILESFYPYELSETLEYFIVLLNLFYDLTKDKDFYLHMSFLSISAAVHLMI